jgi:hypothetical protein
MEGINHLQCFTGSIPALTYQYEAGISAIRYASLEATAGWPVPEPASRVPSFRRMGGSAALSALKWLTTQASRGAIVFRVSACSGDCLDLPRRAGCTDADNHPNELIIKN